MNSKLGNVLALVLLLIIGSALVSNLPTPDEVRNRPFERDAVIGQDVSTRAGTYQVVTVQGATSVSREQTGSVSTITTTGVLLVLTIWHAGREAPSLFSTPQIRDTQGRLFSGAQPVSTCGKGQPVLGETCDLVIEVSPTALAGAQLRIPAQTYTDGEHDDVAVIDLGITPQQVSEWQQRTSLTLPDPRPGRP